MTHNRQDPLAKRVNRVAGLVKELRQEMEDLRVQLADARLRIEELDEERGTIRQRVKRMLEHVGG